jgi:hypothetical protein
VDDLPVGGTHGLEFVVLTGPDDLLGCGLHDRDELLPMASPEAIDVQQQPHAPLGLAKDGQAGQFLEGVERLAIGPEERLQLCALEIDVASDLIDPCRDIAIHVQRVEEPFEEVARPLGVLLDHLRCDGLVSISIGTARGSGGASSRSVGRGGGGCRLLTISRTRCGRSGRRIRRTGFGSGGSCAGRGRTRS